MKIRLAYPFKPTRKTKTTGTEVGELGGLCSEASWARIWPREAVLLDEICMPGLYTIHGRLSVCVCMCVGLSWGVGEGGGGGYLAASQDWSTLYLDALPIRT